MIVVIHTNWKTLLSAIWLVEKYSACYRCSDIVRSLFLDEFSSPWFSLQEIFVRGMFIIARFISWCLPARAVSQSIYKWSRVVSNVCPSPVPGITWGYAVSSTRIRSPRCPCVHFVMSLTFSPSVRCVSVRMTDQFLCTSRSWDDGFWRQRHVVTSEETKKKKVNTARQLTTACVNIPIVRSLGRCAFLSDFIFSLRKFDNACFGLLLSYHDQFGISQNAQNCAIDYKASLPHNTRFPGDQSGSIHAKNLNRVLNTHVNNKTAINCLYG